MRYIINKANDPAYLQLYHQLRDDIINGVFGYNSKLPSKRVFSHNVGVSAITVEHAYALLCDEGYAESQGEAVTMSLFRAEDGFAAPTNSLGTQPTDSHPWPSHPDFLFSLLSKTIRRVLAIYKETLLEKAPNTGCTELRTALKHYLARTVAYMIENDEVETLIVQDLSRFGREYLQVGYYTEIFFPQKGVRFIAVNDAVDSLVEGSNDFNPIRNWVNELHAKENSKKVRTTKRVQVERSERFSGKVPYGCKKKSSDGKDIVPDEETSVIVQYIFKLCAGGKGPSQTAQVHG